MTGPAGPVGRSVAAGGPSVALVERVRRRLAGTDTAPTEGAVAAAVRAEQSAPLGHAALRELAARTRSELVGAGPLEPLLADPQVSDVLVNGAAEVWVDRGGGLHRVPVGFADDAAVRRLAQRLAAACGRRLDDARPWVDARLPDGTRLHAVLPPIAVDVPLLSLRTVRSTAYTVAELVEVGTIAPAAADVLAAVVSARLAFLVTGGTGSGKTTLLGALLALADPGERLVLVEDAAELRPRHPHVVALQARPANSEGAGAVTLRDLTRQALRMRPDRLVVGECRGAEVVEMLAALNTGHEGGAGTLHANAPQDVPARLEALAALGGMSRAALHSQLAPAVQCVVHLRRTAAGRRVESVSVVSAAGPDGSVAILPAWRRDGGPVDGRDRLAARLAARGVAVPAGLR